MLQATKYFKANIWSEFRDA